MPDFIPSPTKSVKAKNAEDNIEALYFNSDCTRCV